MLSTLAAHTFKAPCKLFARVTMSPTVLTSLNGLGHGVSSAAGGKTGSSLVVTAILSLVEHAAKIVRNGSRKQRTNIGIGFL